MADTFYTRTQGRVLGPFDEQKLKSLARRGQLHRMHELSEDGISWHRASSFPHLFELGSSPTSEPDDETGPGPTPTGSEAWYYAINNVDQAGPVHFAQLQGLAATGQISAADLVWKEGMEQWTPAGQIPGLISGNTRPPLAIPTGGPGSGPRPAPAQSNVGTWVLAVSLILVAGVVAVGAVTWSLTGSLDPRALATLKVESSDPTSSQQADSPKSEPKKSTPAAPSNGVLDKAPHSIPSSIFRKELFADAHRYAVACTLDKSNLDKLTVEMKVLKPGLKSKAEHDVLKMLELFQEVEAHIVVLDSLYKLTGQFADYAQENATTLQQIGNLSADGAVVRDRYLEHASMYRRGHLLIQGGMMLAKGGEQTQAFGKELLDKYAKLLTPIKGMQGTYVNYQQSKTVLSTMAAGYLELVGMAINNNGVLAK